jgi:hypothetical protein
MGIRFYCPNGHKLNVKEFQAGRKGICPFCGAKILIPTESNRPSSKHDKQGHHHEVAAAPVQPAVAAPSAAMATPTPIPAIVSNAGAAQPAMPAVSVEPTSAPATAPSASTFASSPTTFAAAPGDPAAADPLTEAGDVVWYVRPVSGGQFGPAAGDVMRGWLAEGRISADSLVWREGWRDWQEAGSVFPQLSPGVMMPGLEAILSESAAPALHGHPVKRHHKSRGTQAVLIAVLAVAVVVLFIVLVWVLMK